MPSKTRRTTLIALAAIAVGFGVFLRVGQPDRVVSSSVSSEKPDEKAGLPDDRVTIATAATDTKPLERTTASAGTGPFEGIGKDPIDALFDRADLLAESSETLQSDRIKRTRIWETDGSIPYIRTVEVVGLSGRGDEAVISRVAMIADWILIQLADEVPDPATLDHLSALGCRLFEDVTGSGLFRAGLEGFQSPDRMTEAIRDASVAMESIQFAEPDYLIAASAVPSDPLFPQQWGLDSVLPAVDGDVDAPEAWELRTTSSSAVVAIIDSGIRLAHEDLAGALWNNPSEVADNGIDDDGNGIIDDVYGFNAVELNGDPDDDNGHGTQVAGIVGAVGNNGTGVAGVSWTSRLMAIKFLNAEGVGTTSDAIASIDYAISEGAAVINASWGSDGRSVALRSAVSRSADAGVLIIAAAGNEGRNIDTTPVYPASFEAANILSVVATDRDGHLAGFSNWGRKSATLGAPGVSILTTTADGDSSYAPISGTSAAVPFVTGAAALLIADGMTGGFDELRNRIVRNGKPMADLLETTASGRLLSVGNALIDLVSTEPFDAFSDPARISGYEVRLSLFPGRGTTEPSEPQHGSHSEQGTLWLSWSTTVAAKVVITLDDPTGEAEIAAYSGDVLEDLVPVATSSSSDAVEFSAVAGLHYRFAVSSPPSGTFSPVVFQLSARPSNDDLEQAPVFVDESFRVTGSTENATREIGEPNLTGRGQSVWWRFIPTVSGIYTIGFEEIQATNVFGLFAREDAGPTGLVPVEAMQGSLEVAQVRAFDLSKGRTYFIGVDSIQVKGDRFTIRGELARIPFIALQPQDTRIRRSRTLRLSVKALGTAPLTFQWQVDGQAIAGQTGPELLIPDIRLDQGGSYSVEITSPTGVIISRSAVVTVMPPTLRIVQQPRDVSEVAGRDAGFAVLAEGEGELSYQWFKNGDPISGATASHLKVAGIKAPDAGRYSVEVRSPFLSLRSDEARLVLVGTRSEDWVWRLPDKPGADFNASHFADGQFVIAGQTGVVATSPDGRSWAFTRIPESFNTYHVGRIGPRWIFIGSRASGGGVYAYLTADFVSWNRVLVGQGNAGNSVFASSGDRAIVGVDGLYSTIDGISWRPVTNGPNALSGAAWANGRFMVISDHPSGNGLFTSPDGEAWENASQDQWNKKIYSDGDWFYINTTRSKDGIEWEELSANHSKPVAMAAKGIFVQVGWPGDPVLVSADATRWSPVASGDATTAAARIRTVASDGSVFVLAGDGGVIATGTNQDSMAYLTSVAPSVELAESGGLIFAFGETSYFSPDGLDWTEIPHPGYLGEAWEAVFHHDGQFLLVDSENDVFAGTNPLNLAPAGFNLNDSTAYGFDRFWRVDGAKIEGSADTQIWAAVADVPVGFRSFESFHVGGRLFLGGLRQTLVTTDGSAWTTVDLLESVRAIAWSGSRFAAVIDGGRIATSTDGITWSLLSATPNGAFTVAYGDGRFMVGTSDGSYYESLNLGSWTRLGTLSGFGGRIIHAHHRFLLTANSSGGGRYPTSHARGQGIQTLGGPAGLPPSLALEGIEAESYTLPLYSRLTSRPIAVDPDGNLAEVTLSASGLPSWLTEDPDGTFTFDPTIAGSQSLTVRASDSVGHVSTEFIRVQVQNPAPVPELPVGYLGRKNTAVYFNGSWWAFGRDAAAARSRDGLTWEHFRLDPAATVMDVAVVGDVLAGVTLDLRLVGSADGVNWFEVRSAPSGAEVGFPRLIDSGGRVYYRETRSNTLTSTDGRNWEPATGVGGIVFTAVAKGMTIARTEEGGWFFSTDGIAFAPLESPYTESPYRIDAVAAGNGIFVILGRDGRVFRTADPSGSWTGSMTIDLPIMAGGSLEFLGGRFYVGQRSFPSGVPAFASVDAVDWLNSESPPSREVIVDGNRLIALGTPELMTSVDGLKWDIDSSRSGAPGGVIPGDRGYLSFSGGSGGSLWFDGGASSFSINGIDWSNPLVIGSGTDPRILSISSLAGRRFLVDTAGVRVSESYGPWTAVTMGKSPVRSAAASDSTVVALTQDREIWASSGESDWSKVSDAPAAVEPAGDSLTFAGERFFLKSDQDDLFWSLDGTAWTDAGLPGGSSGPIRGVTHGSGTWVVTKGAFVYRSTDLENWSSRTDLGATGPVRSLDDRFYLPVQGGYHDSADAIDWNFHPVDASHSYYRVVRLHGEIVLLKTDPERPSIGTDVISSGTYTLLTGPRAGATEFSGSPYVYDGLDAGNETYLIGHRGTLLRVPRLDLRIESIAVENEEPGPGEAFSVTVAIRNPTPEAVPEGCFGSVDFVLTADATVGGEGDRPIGSLSFVLSDGLGPGVTTERTGSLLIPESLSPGTYQLGAHLTSNLVEANRDNNRFVAPGVSFSFAPRTLSVSVVGPGHVSGLPNTPFQQASGSRLVLVPVADPGAHFVRWEGDTDGGIGVITLRLDTDRAVTAVFSHYLTLDLSVDGKGRVLTDLDPDHLHTGATLTVEAIPEAGWSFSEWSGGTESVQPVVAVTVLKNEQMQARFTRTRQSYLDFHFTEQEQADPAVAGDAADPDQDGLHNLTEFVFNLDPRSPDEAPVFRTYRDGPDLCFLFPRNRHLDGRNLICQFSSDLQEWQTDGLIEKTLESDGVFDYVEARVPEGAVHGGYFRLQVAAPSQ